MYLTATRRMRIKKSSGHFLYAVLGGALGPLAGARPSTTLPASRAVDVDESNVVLSHVSLSGQRKAMAARIMTVHAEASSGRGNGASGGGSEVVAAAAAAVSCTPEKNSSTSLR